MASLPHANLTLVRNAGTRAHYERWVCIGCEHVWPLPTPPPRYCRKCGVVGGYAPEDVQLHGTQSAEVGELVPGVIVPDWAHLLPKGLPRGLSMVMRGRPGGGKSRAAFRLASQMGTASIFGLEMGKVLSKETGSFAGAVLDNCWWYDDMVGLEDLAIISPAVVVVDSLQKLKPRKSIVKRLRDWAMAEGRNVLFVSQLGQHGSSRHGEDDDFDCDVVVDVSPGMIDGTPCRNRHGINDKPIDCREGCAHVRIAKSRVCQLIGGDVPIVAGF